MGSSVVYCKECRACNWANKDKCVDCGGELEPTLAMVHAYYCGGEFKKKVDENKKEGEAK